MFEGIIVRKAFMLQQKEDYEGAKKIYGELYAKNYIRANYILPYSVLLLRDGGEENYKKVLEMLKKAEKAKDVSPKDPGMKAQLFVNYAVAQYKLGNMEAALKLLEASNQKAHTGLTYEALGFLYIEAGDKDKALAYNLEALDYDDEDPVTLDNVGQMYYRMFGEKEKAREYFEKAIAIKETQIDTLYFLSLYDEEEGKIQDAVAKLEKALKGRFSPLNYATKERVTDKLNSLRGKL